MRLFSLQAALGVPRQCGRQQSTDTRLQTFGTMKTEKNRKKKKIAVCFRVQVMVRTRASKLLLSGDVSTNTASGHLHKRWRRVKKGVEGSVQNLNKPWGKVR